MMYSRESGQNRWQWTIGKFLSFGRDICTLLPCGIINPL